MKTLIGTAIGALALGGLLTAQAMKTPTVEASKLQAGTTLTDAPAGPVLVNCGEGRQALVKPVALGQPQVVECVSSALALQPFGTVAAFQPLPTAAPAVQERVVYRDRVVTPRTVRTSSPTYRTAAYEPRPVQTTRSWKKSALIIGGGAAAGAGLGAVIDGGSGAKKGAVIGGVAGTVYDLATRNKTRYE